MKRFELVLVILIALILLSKITLDIRGTDLLLFILLMVLSTFYFTLGFFLINNVELKNITNKSTYQSMSVMRILGSLGAVQGLATLAIGVLFLILHYGGAMNLLVIGLVTAVAVMIVGLIRYFVRKDKFYRNLITRFSLWCAMGITCYLIYQ